MAQTCVVWLIAQRSSHAGPPETYGHSGHHTRRAGSGELALKLSGSMTGLGRVPREMAPPGRQ